MRKAAPAFVLIWLASSFMLPALAAPAQSDGRDPFIFVLETDDAGQPGTGLAWWLLKKIIRPTGTVIAGVPLARINEELGPAADRWCFANALTPSSFVSPSRHVQQEIETSMRDGGTGLFHASGPFTGGPILDAVVGNYETCSGVDGAFLLITDRARPGQLVYVKAFTDWDGLIHLENRDGRLIVSSCFECGHAEGLFYDRRRARFYWRDLGD